MVQQRRAHDELRLHPRLAVIKLRWLLLDRVGYGRFVLQYFVDDAAGLGDVRMVTLNFYCPVGHFVDGLVHHDGRVRLPHDFIYLVPLGADQQGDHALRYEYYDGEVLASNFLEHLVDVGKQGPAALVLALHFLIINLRKKVTT